MGIFLEPETTFSVSVKHLGGGSFEVVEGGDISIRSATGREFAAITKAIREQNDGAAYDILKRHVVSGIDKDKIERLHPNVAALLAIEVANRSHLQEEDAGN